MREEPSRIHATPDQVVAAGKTPDTVRPMDGALSAAVRLVEMPVRAPEHLPPVAASRSGISAAPLQRIRIKLDHAHDPIMNNVRAAPVPKAGRGEVDGLLNYDPNHRPIGIDENIVLEGHGTYLDPRHAEGAPYDSQAELGPQQLANVAFLVPKPPDWKGQIILFGCATGSLTMEVSRHYLALSGQSVNVVGTLADIRMEVPNGVHADHHAEYDRLPDGRHPRAPNGSVSARTRYRQWLRLGQMGAEEVIPAIELSREDGAFEGNHEARNRLVNSLSLPLQQFRQALVTAISYQGGDGVGHDILQASEMLRLAEMETEMLKLRLSENIDGLDEHASMLSIFLAQLISDFDVFDRVARRDERVVPAGTVDWEGENVLNSKADEADGLPTDPLPRGALSSDKWGRRGGGGMAMLLEHQLEEF